MVGLNDTIGKSAPYVSESPTSKAAARLVNSRVGNQTCKVIQAILLSKNGMTRYELSKQLGIKDSAVDARVWQLKKDGFVYEPGEDRTTDTGSPAKVVKLTEAAITEMYKDKILFDKIVFA